MQEPFFPLTVDGGDENLPFKLAGILEVSAFLSVGMETRKDLRWMQVGLAHRCSEKEGAKSYKWKNMPK